MGVASKYVGVEFALIITMDNYKTEQYNEVVNSLTYNKNIDNSLIHRRSQRELCGCGL